MTSNRVVFQSDLLVGRPTGCTNGCAVATHCNIQLVTVMRQTEGLTAFIVCDVMSGTSKLVAQCKRDASRRWHF